MQYDPQGDIAVLMKLYNQEVKKRPELPDQQTLLLRARLVFEEAMEFVKACGCSVSWSRVYETDKPVRDEFTVNLDDKVQPDLIEYVDGGGDLLVVTYGALNAAGVKARPVWNEIQRSNMSKVWPDGTIHKRADGKVVKPPTYSPADIAGVLKRMAASSSLAFLVEEYPEIQEAANRGQHVWSWIAAEAFGSHYHFTYDMAEKSKEYDDALEFSRIRTARNAAKMIVFLHDGELTVSALAEALKTTKPIAEELLGFFAERFPRLLPEFLPKEFVVDDQAA